MTDRTSALEGFEDAGKRFAVAIGDAPTEALGYLSSGDDYSLGGLATHVNGVLRRYGRVLDAILADPVAELDAKSIDDEMERANTHSKEGLTAAQRVQAIATMAALHAHVARALSELASEDWDRKTPVRYGDGELYPTSAADIAEWLTGHYWEHVPHVDELLERWSAAGQPTSP